METLGVNDNERTEIYQTVHPSDWQRIRKLEMEECWQKWGDTEPLACGCSWVVGVGVEEGPLLDPEEKRRVLISVSGLWQ